MEFLATSCPAEVSAEAAVLRFTVAVGKVSPRGHYIRSDYFENIVDLAWLGEHRRPREQQDPLNLLQNGH